MARKSWFHLFRRKKKSEIDDISLEDFAGENRGNFEAEVNTKKDKPEMSNHGEQSKEKESREEAFATETKDLRQFFVGKSCQRSGCYFATEKTMMNYCPYCSSELEEVYDYFAMFSLRAETPFFSEELAVAYKRLSKVYHPDLVADSDLGAENFLLLTRGMRILKDGATRQRCWHQIRKCEAALVKQKGAEEMELGEEIAGDTKPKDKTLKKINLLLASLLTALSLGLFAAGNSNKNAFIVGALIMTFTFLAFKNLYRLFYGLTFLGLFLGFVFALNAEQNSRTLLFFVAMVFHLAFSSWFLARIKDPRENQKSL